jgi:fibro-slime domain-containing protein
MDMMRRSNPVIAGLLVWLVSASAAALEVPATSPLYISGVVRSFSATHPDFRTGRTGLVTGAVLEQLGSNFKPLLRSPVPAGFSTREHFDEWFTTTAGVNEAQVWSLMLAETAAQSGVFQYTSNAFLPLGSTKPFFTFNFYIHFQFEPGRSLQFTSADDLWVFANSRRVVDLGGVHTPLSATLAFDSLGLQPGEWFELDLFYAHRHVDDMPVFGMRYDSNVSSVPEPAAASLWALGLAALLLGVRGTASRCPGAGSWPGAQGSSGANTRTRWPSGSEPVTRFSDVGPAAGG